MKGAVAAGHPATVDAAADVLRLGGSAVDALVAGVFASFACEFFVTNPGAGALAMVHEPGGRVRAFDCFAAMPGLGAPPPSERGTLDFHPVRLAFNATAPTFHVGRASVGVPGILRGLEVLHRRYGRLPFGDLVEPGVRLARGGVALAPNHLFIARVLEPILTHSDDLAAVYGRGAYYLERPGALRQEHVARVLERIRDEGVESFHTGGAAAEILADQRANGGLLTERDLAEYAVLELEPHAIRLDGWTVYTPPLPSMGGTMVAAILALWREIGRSEGFAEPGTVASIHRWAVAIEAVNDARRTLSLEQAGPHSDALVDTLLGRLVDPARKAVRALRPWRTGPRLPAKGNTTHLSVLDASGLAVSLTSSPGESAGFMVPGLGMTLNNMLGEEDLNPQGFHRHPAGSRLPTMMSPALAVKAGAAPGADGVIAFGSGGSTRIRSAISQFIARLVHDGMSLAEAVESERVHFEEGTLHLEGERDPAVVAELAAMGYRVQEWGAMNAFFGGVHAVTHQPGSAAGGWGDSRRAGAFAVVE